MSWKHRVWIICAGILFLGAYGLAHEIKEQEQTKPAQSPKVKAAVADTGADYRSRVEPIFKASCFDCHSNQTRYPWYYRLPGVKSMIDGDIKGARKHMDMSEGYPFPGHGTPDEDLQDILDVLDDGSMPPMEYRVFHWGSGLSKNEKETVKDWAQKGLDKFKETTNK
jgi:hypothetical protein